MTHSDLSDRRPSDSGRANVAFDALPLPGEHVQKPFHRKTLADHIAALDSSLWPIAVVMGAYLIAAMLLPTMAPVSISDDWTYARSVEYLVNEGRFKILSVAAATQIFQLFWGAAFALVFGMDFGALRLSTVVLIFLSGFALYGLCRELGVSRGRSALGAAVYLFNPVLFPISFTFMSDPHFLALLVISCYGYVRGLRPGRAGELATIAGSVVAALACLQRPHGALIPLGVATYLVLARRLRFDRQSALLFARVVAIPACVFLAYYLVVSRGMPSQQGLFLDEAKTANWNETWLLFRRLTVMELSYLGLFVLPIVLAAVGSLWGIFKRISQPALLVFLAWESILIAGVVWFWGEGRRMPYIPHFLGRGGPGSGDLRNARPALAPPETFDWITIGLTLSAVVAGLVLAHGLDRRSTTVRPGAGMLLAISAWQIAGVLPQSFLFRNWIVSLDRYLLPILPFAIVLMLWALNRWPIRQEIAWVSIAAIALFSAVGTRDALVFQTDVWSLARQLNEHGVANSRLDAGYAWDAYHLWEFGEQYDIPRQTPDGTWWTDVYARPTDSTYVIAGGPLPGYQILSAHPYSAWLQRDPVALYVLRREGAAPDDVQWP